MQVGVLGQRKESIAGHFVHGEIVKLFERALRVVSEIVAEAQPEHDLT